MKAWPALRASRINRACAEDWLAGSRRPTSFDWQINNFSTYLRGATHNTNLIDSPQFLRGSENFRLALGFMDGKQMNGDGAWLPVADCPRAVDPPSHLCVSLTIADKDTYISGTTGQMDVTFTLHHRDPKSNLVRSMRRTFCWGTSGSEVRVQTPHERGWQASIGCWPRGRSRHLPRSSCLHAFF